MAAGVQSYEDPVLGSPESKLELCFRLALAEMLAATSKVEGAVKFCAMVQKLEECSSGSEPGSSPRYVRLQKTVYSS